jgi:D-alanine-D-alanine ligase
MKPILAFVTGGYSGESVISYKSAITIQNNLEGGKYQVYRIDITPDSWFHTLENGTRVEIDRNDFSLKIADRKICFDAILIGIHGTPGEDGKLQGYFDLMNIPYTSCSAAVSALTFNKRYTVAVAAYAGIRVARSVLLMKDQYVNADEIVNGLRFPVFVKPNNGGSSIGMSKVDDSSDGLQAAIAKAFKEDQQVLVEEFITGREFTIGVFRYKGEIVTLPFTEIKTKKAFFDYEAKYTPGLTDEITPAQVDESIAASIRATARKVYQVFNCRGVVRIDFIYNDEQQVPFMLEINTVPGQTEESLVPQQVRAMGWTLREFYTALIDETLANRR